MSAADTLSRGMLLITMMMMMMVKMF